MKIINLIITVMLMIGGALATMYQDGFTLSDGEQITGLNWSGNATFTTGAGTVYTLMTNSAPTDDYILKIDDATKTVGWEEEAGGTVTDYQLGAAGLPNHYAADQTWQAKGNASAADRYALLSPNRMSIEINNTGWILTSQSEIDLATSGNWDSTDVDYTVAATRAGLDFYVYACEPASGTAPDIVLSNSTTYPVGYTADSSRKIGGFHCICVAVGTIGGHTLNDYAQGDILPASVWDLEHRPSCSPEGMVYDGGTNLWVDIYLASGTGASTASVYGATISDTRTWLGFVDDGAAVGKRLPWDYEFQSLAAGSNEETNIFGSADPVTTGGHVDTASRRMISDIGCEDCCGIIWQWLLDQSWRADGLPDTGDPTWAWEDLPGAKGSLHKQGTYGDAKLLAGGVWNNAANAGSQSRAAYYYRWYSGSDVGARFVAEPA